MQVIKPPLYMTLPRETKTVFLGGSIEMGVADNWQQRLETHFNTRPKLAFFNPRRDDWDSSWEQKISNAQFNAQVTWELDHLDKADIIVFYFDKETKSPITIGEVFMYAAKSPMKAIVCCPDGFWRKGNIEIVCTRYGVQMVNSFEQLISAIETRLARGY